MDQTLLASSLVVERPTPIYSRDLVHMCDTSTNTINAGCGNRSTLVTSAGMNGPRKMRLNNDFIVKGINATRATKSIKVSFASSGGILIPNSQLYEQRTKDELKDLWYSREELMDSCNEAKDIVKLIHLVGGKLEAIDHSRHCVVGLEKYHGKKEREKYRKLLIRSVLIRQEMNRGLGLGTDENECLSQISQMLSSSFKEFALWQAAMHQFHAYGKSPLPQSLLLQQTQRIELKMDSPSASTHHTANHSTVHEMDEYDLQEAAGTTTGFTAAETSMRETLLIGSPPVPIVRTVDPHSSPCDTSARVSRDSDQQAIVHRTQQPQCSLEQQGEHQRKRPQEHLQDVKKLMDGYVERKRLRSEVGNLIGAAQLIGSSQMMGSHSIPMP
jgi:hypothetical protein